MRERSAPGGLLLLAAATAGMLFANGRFGVAAAAWLGPALIVRFVRSQPLGRALAGGLVALSAANFVWWRGVFPLSGPAYAAGSVVFGFITLIPYLVDRRYASRLGGVARTLILPSTVVTIETLHSLGSPFGTWGSYACSQSGNLPLVQLASVTGLAGVTFLLLWFATTANLVWEEGFASRASRIGLATYAIALGLALSFGGLRLRSLSSTDTVRVALVTPRIPTYGIHGDPANQAVHEALSSVRKQRILAPEAWESFRRRSEEIDDELLAASEGEMSRGAKVVVWSEGAGIVELADEPRLLARGAETARRSGAYLALSFLLLDRHDAKSYRNKSVLLDPSGLAVWSYEKAHPVPGMESCPAGSGRVPIASTPYGRLATVICFDADFPPPPAPGRPRRRRSTPPAGG